MNGTIFNRLVSSPLTNPATQPVNRQAAMATAGAQRLSHSWVNTTAKTVAASESVVPTDKLIPPEMMTSVIPRAATAMVEVCTAAPQNPKTPNPNPSLLLLKVYFKKTL